jgi:hypothetical protein
MIHTNFTPIGRKEGDFPGSIIPNHSVNGAAEWAYGVTDWFEQGLYMPVWSPYSEGRGGSINGFKLRELFVKPHAAEQKFFYGVNFEFSVNYLYWEPRHITSEIRPIMGLHLKPFDIIINPQQPFGHLATHKRGRRPREWDADRAKRSRNPCKPGTTRSRERKDSDRAHLGIGCALRARTEGKRERGASESRRPRSRFPFTSSAGTQRSSHRRIPCACAPESHPRAGIRENVRCGT